MKQIITFCLAGGLLLSACDTGSSVNSDATTEETPGIVGNYGETVADENVANVQTMFAALNESGSFEGKVVGEIKEVCKSKGCWLSIELPNGELMRVTFKDYGFFVPTDSKGHLAVLEGRATKTTTSKETLRHYAEDAGKSAEEVEAIQGPKEEFTFEADGVLLKSAIAS
ncbi:DUF4920 domain-containing protein [Litoribacter ruber]|uniref:DUF4920 domain-containing protein n=1 Tax=Litoribacter ruber TaxID=702568 RepID=A0AAP2G1S5_9BACT|nr:MULTISPECIES: DUF4920 domain-containing protein [Litoribacter]MBS9524662.1 DUF4920 domain-containing protein [Litoribacter alkaliphilus]MBT0812682.1 DUF4920 domain-containing protein [Litoribacter ruber]